MQTYRLSVMPGGTLPCVSLAVVRVVLRQRYGNGGEKQHNASSKMWCMKLWAALMGGIHRMQSASPVHRLRQPSRNFHCYKNSLQIVF